MVLDMRRPDRRTPMKARVKKTYKFADEVWKLYVHKNMQYLHLELAPQTSMLNIDAYNLLLMPINFHKYRPVNDDEEANTEREADDSDDEEFDVANDGTPLDDDDEREYDDDDDDVSALCVYDDASNVDSYLKLGFLSAPDF